MQSYINFISISYFITNWCNFYGHRKITTMEVEINKNHYDIEALRNLISRC